MLLAALSALWYSCLSDDRRSANICAFAQERSASDQRSSMLQRAVCETLPMVMMDVNLSLSWMRPSALEYIKLCKSVSIDVSVQAQCIIHTFHTINVPIHKQEREDARITRISRSPRGSSESTYVMSHCRPTIHPARSLEILTLIPGVELIDPLTRYDDMALELPPPGWPILQTDFSTPPDCGEDSYVGTGKLQGLNVLVTGGDSGIGRAAVIAFAREGANVAINYLPEEEPDAQDLANVLIEENLALERIPGDLSNETFCGWLVEEAADRLGGLDILVGNAG